MTGGLMLRGELIGISAQYREAVFYTGRILKARNPPTCRCSKNLRSRAGCEPGRKFERGFDELAARHIDMLLAADPKMALSVRSRRRVRRRSMIAIDYDPVALGYVMSLARHRHRATSRRDFVPGAFRMPAASCVDKLVTPSSENLHNPSCLPPRFRALVLFERRPPLCVDKYRHAPASEDPRNPARADRSRSPPRYLQLRTIGQ